MTACTNPPGKTAAEKKLAYVQKRMDSAQRMVDRSERLMQRHGSLASKHACNEQMFCKHDRLRSRYGTQYTRWSHKAMKLATELEILKKNQRVAARLDMDAALKAAPEIMRRAVKQAQEAAREAGLAALSPKEARKAAREEEHTENRKLKEQRQRRARLLAADVDPDDRLATAKRDIETRGIGKAQFASVSGLASILRQASDRVPSRVTAWDTFDRICDQACAGLIGSPKYDVSVSGSANPDMPSSRIEAGWIMSLLSKRIGVDGWGLLYHVIYARQSFVELNARGFGLPREIAARFKVALDGAAAFWGYTDDAPVGREARRILATWDQEAGLGRITHPGETFQASAPV